MESLPNWLRYLGAAFMLLPALWTVFTETQISTWTMPNAPGPITLVYHAVYAAIGLCLLSFVAVWIWGSPIVVKVVTALTVMTGLLLFALDFVGGLLLILNIIPLLAMHRWAIAVQNRHLRNE